MKTRTRQNIIMTHGIQATKKARKTIESRLAKINGCIEIVLHLNSILQTYYHSCYHNGDFMLHSVYFSRKMSTLSHGSNNHKITITYNTNRHNKTEEEQKYDISLGVECM